MIINGILKQARGDISKLNMHVLNKDLNNCERMRTKSLFHLVFQNLAIFQKKFNKSVCKLKFGE